MDMINKLKNKKKAFHCIVLLCNDHENTSGDIYFHEILVPGYGDFKLNSDKLKTAINSFAKNIADDETILMQIDETLFGSGDDGMIATDKKLYFTAGSDDHKVEIYLNRINKLEYDDGKSEGFFGVEGLKINNDKLVITGFGKENIGYIITFLKELVDLYKALKTYPKNSFSTPTPAPTPAKPKDTHIKCLNCGETHEKPTTKLCSKCGRDMYTKNTNVRCISCGGEFDQSEESCPYCGASTNPA
jgi:ribosomal protein L37E